MNKRLTIGLFGFGVVGEGIFEVLEQTHGLQATVKKICIKHPEKVRNAPAHLFTVNYNDLLEDDSLNLIIELIDDPDEAFKIVAKALRKGKAVVSANKAMIAAHLKELLHLQNEFNAPFLYEAAVCGSIPVIRNLEEYYDNDLLQSICGIVNGSTNFILSKMIDEKLSYRDSLTMAQQLGFAESNPDLDVQGYDARNKLVILLLHAHGYMADINSILYRGITQIHSTDAELAEQKGYRIKLIARTHKLSGGELAAFVLPHFIVPQSQLYYVNHEFNGVVIESKLADKQFLFGKGAGRYPTSSAVLSDIAALRYSYKYEYRKYVNREKHTLSTELYLRIYVSFNAWSDINKWDFEWIEEYHSTENRHYIIGVIHYKNLLLATWFRNDDVTIVVMPAGILEKGDVVKKSMKKISLQLAGLE